MKGTKGGRPEARTATAAPARKPGSSRPRNAAASRPPKPAPPPRTPADDTAAPEAPARPPLAFQLVTLVLALAGLGVSIYLTIAHYNTHLTLACPATGAINCEKVTTSPQSYVLGIPVAVLGLAFYVFMTAITTPWAWRARLPALRWARLISVIAGIGFVIYLIYVELFVVNAICLWCTSVHVITFLLFCLIVASAVLWDGSTAATGQRR